MTRRRTDAEALSDARHRWIGRRRGHRTVLDIVECKLRENGAGTPKRFYRFKMECRCGRVGMAWSQSPDRVGKACKPCSSASRSGRASEYHGVDTVQQRRRELYALKEADPDIWTEDSLDGCMARAFIRERFGPLNNAEIGILEGLSRERIRQLAERGIAKMRATVASERTPLERAMEAAS